MKSGRLLILVFILFMPVHTFSQNSKINIYSAGAYEIPYGDFSDEDIYSGKGNANEGSSINLGAQFRAFKKIFVGLESGYYKFGPREKIANYDIYISSFSFSMNISYYFFQTDFRPYVTFGTGISRTILNVQTEFFEESSVKMVPLINLTAGCEMMITEHAALFGFIRWSDAFTRGKRFSYDHFYTLKPEFNATFVGLGLGIKYWIYNSQIQN